MRVEVLGPEAGGSSFLVSAGPSRALLDCGPGTLALLKERDLAGELDAIVISHMHQDHMLDLLPYARYRALRALYRGTEVWKRPRLFVPREGGLRTLLALSAVWFGDRDVYEDAFDLVEYDEGDRANLGALEITFRRTLHSSPCFAPRVTDGRSTVFYSGDAGYASNLASHAGGADLMVCDATFLRPDPHWTDRKGHMTGELAGKLAAEAGAKRLVLVHLGPDRSEHVPNLEKAKAAFGGVVDLGQAGAVFDL